MKVGIILALVILGTFTSLSNVYGVGNSEFGLRFLPTKIVEGSEGIIHVFSIQGKTIVPDIMDGLTVTSLDSSILKVINVNDDSTGFISEVSIKAMKAGTTKISLAAPGFSSKEIPVTVFGNKLAFEMLLIKTVPNDFSLTGPSKGYVSVELADEDGFPVRATEDIDITFSSSSSIVKVQEKNVTIKKGDYFTAVPFEIRDGGEATIYASSHGVETVESEIIKITEDSNQKIKLYVIPDKINSFASSQGHIIVQLQEEGNDKPIIANQDIQINYKVTNSDFSEPTNTSNLSSNIKEDGFFEIKKGTYWGHTTFRTLTGIEDTYDIIVSSEKPLSVDSTTIETVDLEHLDFKLIQFEPVPILATGNRELIGVTYLEDEDENPIKADREIDVKIGSSDEEFLTIDLTRIKLGHGSSLVFGNVGHSVPKELDLHAQVDGADELIETKIFGPKKDSLKLFAEPLLSKVLYGTDFPLAVYLKDGNELTSFPEYSGMFVTPSEFVDIKTKNVLRGDGVVLLDSKTLQKGSDKLNLELEDYSASVTIESLASGPAKTSLEFSNTIFSGTNDVFALQILNANDLPVFANEDIEFTIIAKDESILGVPDTIMVKKDTYYTLFDVAPKKVGATEVSILADEMPLLKKQIEITSLKPELQITAPDSVESFESFMATIDVKSNNNPLLGINVNWNIDGGIIQLSDTKTGTTGKAVASILPVSEQPVTIKAQVSGSGYPSSEITKTVVINATSEPYAFTDEGVDVEFTKFEIYGIDPVLFIIPAAIVGTGIMFKKKGLIKVKQ